jgi:hypothetical protein
MDETCWRPFETPRKVVAEKGCDTIRLESITGEKASFTALGAISSAGEKLPFGHLPKVKQFIASRNLGHIQG